MSWDGYEQLICVNGHYSEAGDLREFETVEKTCPHCTGVIIWFNIVDVTNGSFDETGKRIDNYVKVQKKEPAVSCTCSCCGHSHMLRAATHHIPLGGHRAK